MRLITKFAISSSLLFASTVHAGFLDDISKTVQIAKKVSASSDSAAPRSATMPATNSPTILAQASNTLALPFNLSIYPQARQYGRIDNPFDRVLIPISTPQKTVDGYVARYNVPVEGRVTMLQFIHRSDDSPILIQRYYEAWLAQAGFDRLLVCASPCSALPSHTDWRQSLDPDHRLDSNFFPDRPTYIAAYKGDAMAIVGIGTHVYDFVSFVKVVEGQVLDAQAWVALTSPKVAPPPVAPSQPALQSNHTDSTTETQSASKVAGAETVAIAPNSTSQGAMLEAVAPDNIEELVKNSKGLLLVQLTSQDSNCQYCVQSNPRFQELTRRYPGAARYVQVTWNPWASAFNSPFVNKYRIQGMPTVLVIRDGALVQRAQGDISVDALAALLNSKATGRQVAEEMTPEALSHLLAEQEKEWAASNYGKKPGFKASKMVVQYSSHDPACAPCVVANDQFDKLAILASGGDTRLVRVTWNPWQAGANHPLVKKNQIKGLPTMQKFVMGVRRNQVLGKDLELFEGGGADLEVNVVGKPGTWLAFKLRM